MPDLRRKATKTGLKLLVLLVLAGCAAQAQNDVPPPAAEPPLQAPPVPAPPEAMDPKAPDEDIQALELKIEALRQRRDELERKLELREEYEDMEFGGLGLGMSGLDAAEVESAGAQASAMATNLSLAFNPLFASYNLAAYRWQNVDKLSFGNGVDDPWKQLNLATIGAGYEKEWGESWAFEIEAGVTSAYEKETEDSYSYFGGCYVMYAPNDRWEFSLGFEGEEHSSFEEEDEEGFQPIIGVNWTYESDSGYWVMLGLEESAVGYRYGDEEDGNSFWVALGIEATELGVGDTEIGWRYWSEEGEWGIWIELGAEEVELGVAITEDLAITLTGTDEEGGLYRLADDSPVQPEGYMRSERTGVALGLEWGVSDRSMLNFAINYFGDGEMTIYDKDGVKQADYDQEKTIGAAVSYYYVF